MRDMKRNRWFSYYIVVYFIVIWIIQSGSYPQKSVRRMYSRSFTRLTTTAPPDFKLKTTYQNNPKQSQPPQDSSKKKTVTFGRSYQNISSKSLNQTRISSTTKPLFKDDDIRRNNLRSGSSTELEKCLKKLDSISESEAAISALTSREREEKIEEFAMTFKRISLALKNMNNKYLSFAQKEALVMHFHRLKPLWSLPSRFSADLLWAVGTMKLCLPNEIFVPLVDSYIDYSMDIYRRSKMGIVEDVEEEMKVTKGLIGLVRYGSDFSRLAPDRQAQLLSLIDSYLPSFSGRSMANLIYSMGKIRVRFTNDLSQSFRDALMGKFNSSLFTFQPQELSNALYGFDLMGAQLDHFSHENNSSACLVPRINEALERALLVMNTQEYCNSLHSLAALGFSSSNITATLKTYIHAKFIEILPQLYKNEEIASVYFAFTALNINFDDWSKEEQRKIIEWQVLTGKSFDAISLSTVIISWGKQGKEWIDIPPALQKVFVSQLSAVIHDMKGPYWFVACMQGLGMMRCPWRLVEEIPNFPQFMQVFEEYLPQISNLDLGSLLFHLGKMDFQLPKYYRLASVINSEVLNRLPSMTSVDLSLIFQALGASNYQWPMFSINQMNRIQTRLLELLSDTDVDPFSRLLNGLQAMSARWEKFHPPLIDGLLKRLIDTTATMNGNSMWRISSSLGELGLSWNLIPTKYRELLFKKMIENLRTTNNAASFTPYLLYSLGILEADWDDISNDVKKSLCENMRQTKDFLTIKDVSVGMYGLALLTTRFAYDIPHKGFSSQDKSKPHFHSAMFLWFLHTQILTGYQHIASLPTIDNPTLDFSQLERAWIPGVSMYLEFMKCFPTTRTCLEEVSESGAGNASIAHPEANRWIRNSCSPYVSPLLSVLKDELDGFSSYLSESFPAVERVVTDVSLEEQHRLNSLYVHRRFIILEEYDGLETGCFPMDIAIAEEYSLTSSPGQVEEEIIAFIEIDGARHYTTDAVDDVISIGSLRTNLRRPGMLKELIYGRRYPTTPIYRIPTIKISQGNLRENVKSIIDHLIAQQFRRRLRDMEGNDVDSDGEHNEEKKRRRK